RCSQGHHGANPHVPASAWSKNTAYRVATASGHFTLCQQGGSLADASRMIPRERLPGRTLLERELAFASSLPEFNYLVSLAGTRTMAGSGEITYDQAEIV